jgi:hypothetical protein
MALEFIDNNATIDQASKKRIRRHVAIGRNTGKVLVRPSRKKLERVTANSTALTCLPIASEHIRGSLSREDSCCAIERPVGDVLSVFSFPKQTNPESAGLVQRGMCGAEMEAPLLRIIADGIFLPSFILH